jgi:molybdopterin-guanine dinucleotide biosynthesis protein A
MGRDKLRLDLDGRTFLESAVERFSARFDTVLVSVARPGAYGDMRFDTVPDVYVGCGPLAGLHAALARADETGVFLVAGDLPFADPDAALCLIQMCGEHEICVLEGRGGADRREPLFGFYKKMLLPKVESSLREGKRSMSALLAASDTLYIPPALLGDLWDEQMLYNVNTPPDYAALPR